MLTRRIATRLDQALQEQAAVALLGPRQVGKTTIALALGESRKALYLDLEDPADRAKLTDARLFLEHHEDRLVILDEVHRMPGLFGQLRGLIDRGRRRGRRSGRFLLLGSASLDVLQQAGETLAGRVAYIELFPFDVLEVGDEAKAQLKLWMRGGFPDSYLARSDAQSLRLRKDFIRAYLHRDVSLFSPRMPAETLERLWTMLAHDQGGLLNQSKLAGALGISAQTVARYTDLLVDLLLVRRLPPCLANVGKRLVKSPKVYIRDSGLVHALLNLPDLDAVAGHPVAGASWEGFVIENLLAVAPPEVQASFYRTAAGAEIDLVLDFPGGDRWVVEIKRGTVPRLERGFHHAREDLSPARAFVVSSGEDAYPLAEGVDVIGLRELADRVRVQAAA